MNIDHIHWHDSILHRVVEDTKNDLLSFEVDYPVNWEEKLWERKVILFKDALNYEVHEGPFYGPPTILDVAITGSHGERKIIKIETNAGYRQLACTNVEIAAN